VKKSPSRKPTKKAGYSETKTFTYFIPTPPKRQTGYREREFDKIMHGILNDGHEIIDWKIESAGGDEGGLFVVFLLRNTNKKNHGPALDIHEKFGLADHYADDSLELIGDET
jgi:hypothetical protein